MVGTITYLVTMYALKTIDFQLNFRRLLNTENLLVRLHVPLVQLLAHVAKLAQSNFGARRKIARTISFVVHTTGIEECTFCLNTGA